MKGGVYRMLTFYLQAIFTALLKTKLFCPKIEIKTIGIINRYRNIISHTTLTYNRMPIYTKAVI